MIDSKNKNNISFSHISPFRYPGGKTKLYPQIVNVLSQDKSIKYYSEPYAGGAGLGLKLLLKNKVNEIFLNDIDPAMYAAWDVILNHSDVMLKWLRSVSVSLKEWHVQKEIYENPNSDLIELGLATFFLNRTNRSGIISTGGPIGGKDQSGKYKIDARFNRDSLSSKIRFLKENSSRIHLSKIDGISHIREVLSTIDENKLLFLVGPPYLQKADKLYKMAFTKDNHIELSKFLISISNVKWVLTYDKQKFIADLYSEFLLQKIKYSYSITRAKKVEEYFISSTGMERKLSK